MGLILILAALYAMIIAAFVSGWIIFREFRPALKAGGLAAVAFFVMFATWLGLTEPRRDIDDRTLSLIILGAGFISMAALTRWLVRPARGRATIGESATIALISVAAMAGTYAAGVAWLSAN